MGNIKIWLSLPIERALDILKGIRVSKDPTLEEINSEITDLTEAIRLINQRIEQLGSIKHYKMYREQ